MTAPALTKPKRVRYKRATDPLDMRHAALALARDHAERMDAPSAAPCRCERPLPMGERCAKCGRAPA